MPEQYKEYSLEELAEGNGQDGRPVLIAFKGKVIDVSQSKLWRSGSHMNTHIAGRDLTEEIAAAPHGLEVLARYPQVGVLREAEAAAGPRVPAFLAWLFRQVPLLRRHPHPMTVHFPIAYMLSTSFFMILYFITGEKSFEFTALSCLGAGILFTPIAILTGLLTWWLNYNAQPLRPVVIKMILAPIMLGIAAAALVWRWLNPEISQHSGMENILYFALIFSLSPLVGLIGWYGAKLTFPISKD